MKVDNVLKNRTVFFNEVSDALRKSGNVDNDTHLADLIDWHKSPLSQVRKGKRDIPLDKFELFVEKFNLKDDYENFLVTLSSRPSRINLNKDENEENCNQNLKEDVSLLTNYEGTPMYPSNELSFDPDSKLPVPDYRILDEDLASADLGLILRGSSMYPKFMPGSRIAVKKIDRDDIIFSHIYYVITAGGVKTVVYVEPHETKEDWVILRPHNPDMKPTPIDRAKIKHIYLVVGSVQYE